MNLFNKTSNAKEGKELTISNLLYEISKIENEKELLNDKIQEQDKLLFKITQENAMLEEKLENTTDERSKYKETINQICDKYSIDHKEVYKIIDNINSKERER